MLAIVQQKFNHLLQWCRVITCRHDIAVWMTTEWAHKRVVDPVFDFNYILATGKSFREYFFAEDLHELRCFTCDKLLNRDIKKHYEKPFPTFRFCFDKKRHVHKYD